MQPRTRLFSAFTLSTAMAFGAAAMAADLPKEGTFSGTYSSAGTYKAHPVGKERVLAVYDENGLTVGNGLLDHMTWHCDVLGDLMNGTVQWNGYCVLTDPAGDQIAANVASDGKYAADAKSFSGKTTFTTGTGKYVGISGGVTAALHAPEFRTAGEGTYVQYGNLQGSYKLP
jgi:hypothetical protein